MHDVMSLSELQRRQPWTVPYSLAFLKSAPRLQHLKSSHAVLHAAKSVGKLAAVFEAADHGHDINEEEVANMCADLVTAAMRLANLYSFDLQFVLERRVKEKNGIGFDEIEG
jgi:hypothetical protein